MSHRPRPLARRYRPLPHGAFDSAFDLSLALGRSGARPAPFVCRVVRVPEPVRAAWLQQRRADAAVVGFARATRRVERRWLRYVTAGGIATADADGRPLTILDLSPTADGSHVVQPLFGHN